jgi:hypothetical protein
MRLLQLSPFLSFREETFPLYSELTLWMTISTPSTPVTVMDQPIAMETAAIILLVYWGKMAGCVMIVQPVAYLETHPSLYVAVI